jgi:hypothetical protein
VTPREPPFRLDVRLWGVNLDEHATPEMRFIDTARQINLHRRLAAALGHRPAPGEDQQTVSLLLGRRVTTFRSIRTFEFRTLAQLLDEQVEDDPATVYAGRSQS